MRNLIPKETQEAEIKVNVDEVTELDKKNTQLRLMSDVKDPFKPI